MRGKTAVPKKTKYAELKERALKRVLQRIEKPANDCPQQAIPKK
jgi:hypothetical protein